MKDQERDHTCIVLDTSAVLRVEAISFRKEPVYLTPSTIQELRKRRTKSLEIDILIESKNIEIRESDSFAAEAARQLAKKSGDIKKLSKTDIDMIALAMQLKKEGERPLVLTDDYAIQNVLSLAEIKYKSIGLKTIRKTIIWQYVCPVCGSRYGLYKVCPVCGSKLVRRTTRGSGTGR